MNPPDRQGWWWMWWQCNGLVWDQFHHHICHHSIIQPNWTMQSAERRAQRNARHTNFDVIARHHHHLLLLFISPFVLHCLSLALESTPRTPLPNLYIRKHMHIVHIQSYTFSHAKRVVLYTIPSCINRKCLSRVHHSPRPLSLFAVVIDTLHTPSSKWLFNLYSSWENILCMQMEPMWERDGGARCSSLLTVCKMIV